MSGTALLEQPTLTVAEVATVLRIGRNAAYELVRSGQLRCVRIGNRILIPNAAIHELLNQ